LHSYLFSKEKSLLASPLAALKDKQMANLQLKNVKKSFGSVQVIKGVDLEIKSGEFMVFVGPSGCGKSTLLRLIAGLEDITSGTLSFDGEVVNALAPSKRGIAMVFQSYALYPHMTVFDNMAFGMQLSGGSKDEIKTRVEKAAELLQITPYLARLPKQLSGGQRQRVAIGRAIAKLHHAMNNVTMVYVTHDQVEAMTLADRICVLRDGLVEQVGTPLELYETPCNIFVAGFIGSPKMNFLEGTFAEPYKAHTIGVRAEHLEVTKSGPWKGKVIHTEVLGSDSYLFVDVGSVEPLIVRENGTTTHTLEKTVSLSPLKGYVHRFDKDGRAIVK
jgi:multiple sugar transport system ATP-binding protein